MKGKSNPIGRKTDYKPIVYKGKSGNFKLGQGIFNFDSLPNMHSTYDYAVKKRL